MLPVDLNNPATWRFLAGYGSVYMMPEDIAQHVVALGANGMYVTVSVDAWDWTGVMPNGLTMKEHTVRLANELKRLGALVYLQVYPYNWRYNPDGTPADYNQYVRNAINDVNGAQQEFIDWCKAVVVDVQPDICQIINEVVGDEPVTGTASEALWTNYVSFCNNYMAQVNAVKPNMPFTISSIPFWTLRTIANRTFTVPSGCRLIYSYHYYYCFFGYYPEDLYPEMQSYWNATTQAELEAAKNQSYDVFMYGDIGGGISYLTSQGKTVLWDEIGTHILVPNFRVWMKDAIDFCLQHGIGFSFLDNTGNCESNGTILTDYWDDQVACEANGGTWQFNFSPAAFWTNRSWNLNALGQEWVKILGSGSGEVALPYSNPLVSLTNLSAINGSWAVQ